jgi:hypothetical protein
LIAVIYLKSQWIFMNLFAYINQNAFAKPCQGIYG